MNLREIFIVGAVAIFVIYAVFKEVKVLLSFKKMPDFINNQSKPVIANSVVLTIVDILLTIMSFAFLGSYWFYVLLLVASLIAIETIFFIDDELHSIIGK